MTHSLTHQVRSSPTIAVSGVIAAGVAAGLIAWSIARLMGIGLETSLNDGAAVGVFDVIIASLVAGAGAWAVHRFMARRGRLVRWWPFVGTTVLSISLIGPGWYADGADAIALICMHFAVGVVLITGFSLLNPRC